MAFEDVKQYFENVGMEDRVIELEKSSATVEEADYSAQVDQSFRLC